MILEDGFGEIFIEFLHHAQHGGRMPGKDRLPMPLPRAGRDRFGAEPIAQDGQVSRAGFRTDGDADFIIRHGLEEFLQDLQAGQGSWHAVPLQTKVRVDDQVAARFTGMKLEAAALFAQQVMVKGAARHIPIALIPNRIGNILIGDRERGQRSALANSAGLPDFRDDPAVMRQQFGAPLGPITDLHRIYLGLARGEHHLLQVNR